MNKVIKGKRYDTETAKMIKSEVVAWGMVETLYKKRTGEFFLLHDGSEGGKWIEIFDMDEAKEWVEEYCSSDTYEALFGATGEEKTDLHLTLSGEDMEKLKSYALERRITVSEAVSKMIKTL